MNIWKHVLRSLQGARGPSTGHLYVQEILTRRCCWKAGSSSGVTNKCRGGGEEGAAEGAVLAARPRHAGAGKICHTAHSAASSLGMRRLLGSPVRMEGEIPKPFDQARVVVGCSSNKAIKAQLQGHWLAKAWTAIAIWRPLQSRGQGFVPRRHRVVPEASRQAGTAPAGRTVHRSPVPTRGGCAWPPHVQRAVREFATRSVHSCGVSGLQCARTVVMVLLGCVATAMATPTVLLWARACPSGGRSRVPDSASPVSSAVIDDVVCFYSYGPSTLLHLSPQGSRSLLSRRPRAAPVQPWVGGAGLTVIPKPVAAPGTIGSHSARLASSTGRSARAPLRGSDGALPLALPKPQPRP
jgi:hypothetical protein